MSGLSKSRIQYHRQCPRRLWLQVYRPKLGEIDPAMQRHFDIGNQVGEIARAFQISGDDRVRLKEMLRELKVDGTVERGGRRRMGAAPSRLVRTAPADRPARARRRARETEDGPTPAVSHGQ